MAFDYKKEYREFYLPKERPEIVTIPPMNFVSVRGEGDPNEKDGDYQRAIGVLYAIAYTLKMSGRAGHEIEGFFDYVVPPLEGFWWQEGTTSVDYGNKQGFCWISAIRLPEFVTPADFAWAVEEATVKKRQDFSSAQFCRLEEGLCVQMMHIGIYDEEPITVEKMDRYLWENGFESDFESGRLHHEIYLSDPRRQDPAKQKTVLRHPIRKR